MSCNPTDPRSPPVVALQPTECFPDPPEGFQPFEVDCPDDLDLDPSRIKAGGKALVVVPYDQDVCSGDKGRFQVLSGFGGQICDALYLGNTVGRRSSPRALSVLPEHKVGLFQDGEFTDDPDCLKRDPDVPGGPNGDRALALSDRGQWYVVRLGQADQGGAGSLIGIVLGGNIPVPASEIPANNPLDPSVVHALPPTQAWDLQDVSGVAGELLTVEPQAGYFTDATVDPLAAHGLRPGVGVAYLYDLTLEQPEKQLVYIVNRVSGLAFMRGQPVFLIQRYNLVIGQDQEGNDLIARLYEAVG